MKSPATKTALLLATTAFLCGCGTGEYEKRASATVTQYQRETPFRELWPEPVKDFPKKGLSLRLPKLFRAGEAGAFNPLSDVPIEKIPPSELTPDPRRPSDVVDPYRVRPSFLSSIFKVPWLQRTYETFVQMPGVQNPGSVVNRSLYFYVAVMERNAKQAKFVTEKELEKQLRDLLVYQFGSKDVSEWETVMAPTPSGESISWKRIRAKGEQWHVFYEGGVPMKNNPPNYPAIMELYLRSTPDYHVILGWRCGEDVAKALNLDAVATATAGTVTLGQ